MPDTPDDPLVELVPEQRADDDTEAASERHAAKARAEADQDPTHDLAEEAAKLRAEEDEQARLNEADEAAHAERVELAAKDELERLELRDRDGLDATAETIRALELAHVDEEAGRRYRQLATTEVQHSVGDLARGRHELDEAAAHPDERGSAGLAAKGRRDERASGIEARRAESYDRRADGYGSPRRIIVATLARRNRMPSKRSGTHLWKPRRLSSPRLASVPGVRGAGRRSSSRKSSNAGTPASTWTCSTGRAS